MAFSQVSDRFDDGDFTSAPAWSGDDSLFRVVSGELRLWGTAASEAHLSTPHTLLDSITWSFYCRFDLSPSAQNFARFYLASDRQDLEGPLNGYYVQLGGVTGNTDSITLYRQNGTARTRIIGGRPGTVSRNSNRVRIKVFRDHAGNWELYSDTSSGAAYVLEGRGFDDAVPASAYLGWYVRYTAGNSQRYFLDDVVAGRPEPDTLAPRPDSVSITSSSSLAVYFSEEPDEASALDLSHYRVSPSPGAPVSVTLSGTRADLYFDQPFVSGTDYLLIVSGVKDLAGNAMEESVLPFSYYIPSASDLLISEFMADPSPPAGLPEYEFVELYNNAGRPLNLGGFTISDGGAPAVLPPVVLAPDSFIMICSSAAAPFLGAYGRLAAVSGMPSLNNSGDQIIVRDNRGTVLHRLTYDMSWYGNTAKSEGGYSIELHYPEQVCRGKAAYSASLHASGGTPGTRNSLWDPGRDTTAPGIASAEVIHAQQLLVVLNEPADIISLRDAHISLDPGVPVTAVQAQGADSLHISLGEALTNNTSYVVQMRHVKDCSGNTADARALARYYVPEEAGNYDVLIHEIMADPDPVQGLPGVEYIELHNRSGRNISLKGWTLGDDGALAKLPAYLLLPDSFVLVTGPSGANLFPAPVLAVTGFPSLGNDGDRLVLKDGSGRVIHAVSYTSAWYEDGFKKQGGFSLEMVDARNPCGPRNWKASADPRGGTPGERNSVKGMNPDRETPRLLRAYMPDSARLQLFFNEPLDSASFRPSCFLLNAATHPVAVSGVANDYRSTVLLFADTFHYGKVYSVMVDSVRDCAQNLIDNYRSVELERACPADSGDLVINEVLFDARQDAYDFVELYNKGNKAVDLKKLLIARRDARSEIADQRLIAPGGFVVRPGEYAVITADAENLQQQYFCRYPAMIIPQALPAYNNDQGTVLLLGHAGNVLDEFSYDEKMHFALLDNRDGVSLERIDPSRPSSQRSNWTSAAGSAGYATPTYRNSQYLRTERSEQVLELQPARISPDGDGYEDIMNIRYRFETNGYMGSLFIYDANGRLVKQLLRNEVLGTEGVYSWDGVTESGNKAPIGMYIFRLEAFSLGGSVKTYQVVGVVAGRL